MSNERRQKLDILHQKNLSDVPKSGTFNYFSEITIITWFIDKIMPVSIALEKPTHKCTQCDASFAQKHNLNRHISTVHDGKKLVICRICNKSFRDNYILKRHQKLHTKPRPDQVSEPKTKIETQEIQDFKVELEDYDFEYADLDLSEEFLTAILKQVSMTSVMKF